MVKRLGPREPMPEPLSLEWPAREPKEAHFRFEQNPDGRINMELRHKVLQGVTPEMLAWWYGAHVCQQVRFGEQTVKANLIWHPRDHVSIEHVAAEKKMSPLTVGDRYVVKEVYQRLPRYYVSALLEVTQLNSRCFSVAVCRFGFKLAECTWTFIPCAEGTEVVTQVLVGARAGVARLVVNNLIVPLLFEVGRTEGWIQHNVEEMGHLEHFLPALYARRGQGQVIDLSDFLGG